MHVDPAKVSNLHFGHVGSPKRIGLRCPFHLGLQNAIALDNLCGTNACGNAFHLPTDQTFYTIPCNPKQSHNNSKLTTRHWLKKPIHAGVYEMTDEDFESLIIN
jgi:hypothetical protein